MITVLVVTAMTLGLLAFFEPCTIATHTLFSARVHRQSSLARMFHRNPEFSRRDFCPDCSNGQKPM